MLGEVTFLFSQQKSLKKILSFFFIKAKCTIQLQPDWLDLLWGV